MTDEPSIRVADTTGRDRAEKVRLVKLDRHANTALLSYSQCLTWVPAACTAVMSASTLAEMFRADARRRVDSA